MRKTYSLRHSRYGEDKLLTLEGKKQCIEKGEALKLRENISEAVSVVIVTSTAPRAKETGEYIALGLGSKNVHFYETKDLWKDNEHTGDVSLAAEFIRSLPDSLLLIIISHLDMVIPIARVLGYSGPSRYGLNYLEGVDFEFKDAVGYE